MANALADEDPSPPGWLIMPSSRTISKLPHARRNGDDSYG